MEHAVTHSLYLFLVSKLAAMLAHQWCQHLQHDNIVMNLEECIAWSHWGEEACQESTVSAQEWVFSWEGQVAGWDVSLASPQAQQAGQGSRQTSPQQMRWECHRVSMCNNSDISIIVKRKLIHDNNKILVTTGPWGWNLFTNHNLKARSARGQGP